MKDTLSKIVLNHRITGDFWRMRLETGWNAYVPGQFVMLRVPGDKVFLRRPFGIARMKGGVAELCYKIVGAGTKVMSGLKTGERVNVLGPLGNGFQISNSSSAVNLRSETLNLKLLVAGGYGVAPLLGLAEGLRGGNIHLLYGTRTKDDLLYLDEFRELGVELHISTEDGSMGEKGPVTSNSIFKPDPKIPKILIFACGPKGMLQRVAQEFGPADPVAGTKGCDCQLSLESYMACGYGVCMGCAVKLKSGEYARVCKDGPVFNADQLEL